jgi:hypothetical protein
MMSDRRHLTGHEVERQIAASWDEGGDRHLTLLMLETSDFMSSKHTFETLFLNEVKEFESGTYGTLLPNFPLLNR